MRVVVRVTPGARSDLVGGRYGDAVPPVLVVRVRAAAVDGKANSAVVKAVADAFGVPPRAVRIVTGAAARTKSLEVETTDGDRLRELLSR